MTTVWMSAQTIADLRLPGLPSTKVGVIDRAKRESWLSRPRTGRGGGREYPEWILPLEARWVLLARRLGASDARIQGLGKAHILCLLAELEVRENENRALRKQLESRLLDRSDQKTESGGEG